MTVTSTQAKSDIVRSFKREQHLLRNASFHVLQVRLPSDANYLHQSSRVESHDSYLWEEESYMLSEQWLTVKIKPTDTLVNDGYDYKESESLNGNVCQITGDGRKISLQ
jgi:hypothetical protein